MLVTALFASTACAVDDDLAIETDEWEIIGGTEHEGSPAVVSTNIAGAGCTGTLVAPKVVLTAGHCIEGAVRAGSNSGRVRFGPGGGSFDASRDVTQLALHRSYGNFVVHDVGMIRLRDPAPEDVEPMPFNLGPLENMLGAQVRVVGFGVSDGASQTGAGTKRQIILQIDGVTDVYFDVGGPGRNICQGDSGGPSFFNIPGQGETVVAVSSFGSDECRAPSTVARTDPYAEEFFIPVFDAWEGECKHDGVCVEDCPRTRDPDCHACGFDGFCQINCEQVDLDCPLGGLAGDSCGNNFDCEGRACIDALDGAGTKYCSAECTEATVTADCDAPLSVCVDGMCHLAPDDPTESGGCSTGRAGASSTGTAWLLALLLVVRTGRGRRRRRSRCRRDRSRPAAY